MPRVLLCSAKSLFSEAEGTFFMRADVERHEVPSLERARKACSESDFELIAVDSTLRSAAELIRSLRRDTRTRHRSIVVVSRSEFDPDELELLEAGANGILRFPPGKDWDERLTRLCAVPVRREARFPIEFEVSTLTGLGAGRQQAQAHNLSVTGLLLESDEDLAIGAYLEFRFTLPESSDVRGSGRVVRRAPRSRLFGVEFEHLEGDAVARIQAFVDERTTTSQAL